jgi:hypothetical protein
LTITIAEATSWATEHCEECGIAHDALQLNQLSELLPFRYIDGHKLVVPKVDGDLSGYASLIGDTGQNPDADFPSVSTLEVPLSYFAAILEVDSLIATHYGSYRNILRSLVQVKVFAILQRFWSMVFNGNSANQGECAGLVELANTYTHEVTSNSGGTGPPLAGEIEAMLRMLSPRRGLKNRYLVMHPWALEILRNSAYQNDIYFAEDERLGQVPVIAGTKVVQSEYIPVDQSIPPNNNLTTIFGVVLHPRTGCFGVLPHANRGQEIQVLGPFRKEGQDTSYFKIKAPMGFGAFGSGVAALIGVGE